MMRARLAGFLRTSALLAVASLLGALALVRAGRASANEALAALARELMRLPGARYANGVGQLSLNGLTLFLQSGASERAPHEVVAEFRAACARMASLSDRGAVSSIAVRTPDSWLGRWLDGVLVQPRGAGTAVACIDSKGQSNETSALLARLQRFLAQGDLGELGRLRYAWVEPAAQGSAFLTLWSDGPLPLLEQFPPHGDAPGVDLPDLPRVAGSRRLLSAALATRALVIYVHEDQALEEVTARYEQTLARAGYVTRDAEEPRFYTRVGRTLVLTSQSDGSRAFVTLLAGP